MCSPYLQYIYSSPYSVPILCLIPQIEKTVETCKELLRADNISVSKSDIGIIAAFRSQVRGRTGGREEEREVQHKREGK